PCVNTWSASFTAVESIQANGKTVRKHRISTIACAPIFPKRSDDRDDGDETDVDATLAIMDMPFTEPELDPGQEQGRDEQQHREGRRRPDLEVFETLLVQVVDDVRRALERSAFGHHVDRPEDIV